MLRIVPHTVPRVGRSYEHFSDGFELHLLPLSRKLHTRPQQLSSAPLKPTDLYRRQLESFLGVRIYTSAEQGYLAHKKTPTPLGP